MTLTTGGGFQQPPVRVICQTFQTQGVMGDDDTVAHDPSARFACAQGGKV
jgi:hypothetical protein